MGERSCGSPFASPAAKCATARYRLSGAASSTRARRRIGLGLFFAVVLGTTVSAHAAVAATSGQGVVVAVELHGSSLVSGTRLSIPVFIRLAPGASVPVEVSLRDPCLAGTATTRLSPHEVPVGPSGTVAVSATETVTFNAAVECTAAVFAEVVLDDGDTVRSRPIGVAAGGSVRIALSTRRVPRAFLTVNLAISSDAAGRFDIESSSTREGPWVPFNSTTSGPTATAPVFDTAPGITYFRVRLDLGGDGSERPISNVVSLTAGRAALPAWLVQLNGFRTAGGLAPVAEDPALDAADRLHVRYEAATSSFGHVELASSPLASTVGKVAGESSVLSVGIDEDAAVSDWMGAPFHALCLLNPFLETVGFAYDAGDAALFCSPRPETPATAVRAPGDDPVFHLGSWPREWPASGETVDLASLTTEEPDPTSSCSSSWRAEVHGRAGLPVIVSFGADAAAPSVAAASLSSAGADVPLCVVTETNYDDGTVYPALGYDAATVGREVMGEYHSVALIPAAPLNPGAEYTASIASNDGTVTWSFGVASSAT